MTASRPARGRRPRRSRSGSRRTHADRFLFVEADIADRDQSTAFVKEVLAKWGSIDVLVNNAGVARDGILALFSDEDSDTVIDLNLKATIHLTRQVVRNMLAHGGGRIVNISSITGLTGYRGPDGLRRDQGGARRLHPRPGPRGRVAQDHRQQHRVGLPEDRDEPRPRRGAAQPDRPSYAGRPARRARRHRPHRSSSSSTSATTGSPDRCWSSTAASPADPPAVTTRPLDPTEVYYEVVDRLWPMNALGVIELDGLLRRGAGHRGLGDDHRAGADRRRPGGARRPAGGALRLRRAVHRDRSRRTTTSWPCSPR